MRQEQCECGRPSIRHDGACSRCAAIEKRLELDFHRATCGFADRPKERADGLTNTALQIAATNGRVCAADLPSTRNSSGVILRRLVAAGRLVACGRVGRMKVFSPAA